MKNKKQIFELLAGKVLSALFTAINNSEYISKEDEKDLDNLKELIEDIDYGLGFSKYILYLQEKMYDSEEKCFQEYVFNKWMED